MSDTPTTAPVLAPWQAQEREDFFSAVARHRRLTWRITAACVLAYLILAVVMATLLAPLLYCIAGLLLDLGNLLHPLPDLLAYAGKLLAPIVDKPETLPISYFVKFILLASAPGLLIMVLVWLLVARAVKHSALFDPQQPLGRAPDTSILAEQQFANTIAEMSVAAQLVAPEVRVVEGGANAAVVGSERQQACIIIGSALLPMLARAQMQGIAAHLVAAIANDDLRIGLRTASLLGVFALIARVAVNMADKQTFGSNCQLLRALLLPTPANQAFILQQLADPFSEPASAAAQTNEQLGWREWLIMPLMGPVWFSGFLGGVVNSLMLSPAIAFAWRQRKYMADATAVRLTREPNGLYQALQVLQQAHTALLNTAWASHLCVVAPGTVSAMIVPIFPALERRLAALIRLGAQPSLLNSTAAPTKQPLLLILLLSVLAVVAAGLLLALIPLLVMASSMLTALFTLLPTAFIHAWLR